MGVHRPLVGMILFVAAVLSALTPMSSSRAGGKPSPIPVVFGPNVNLSVQSSSQGKYSREPTIVVNPANPLNIVEGNIVQQPTQFFGVDSFSFSTDGGQTWTLGGIVPMENPATMPSIRRSPRMRKATSTTRTSPTFLARGVPTYERSCAWPNRRTEADPSRASPS